MITKEALRAYRDPARILRRENDFVYILPHPALRYLVSNYTVTFPSRAIISDCYTVIPHGSATLVFGCDRRGIRGNLFGPMTKPCTVGGLANQSDMLFIIELQPAGLFACTGVPQKELADKILPLEPVHPALHRFIAQALERTADLNELVDLADRYLLESLSAAYPAALQQAVQMIVESPGSLSCKAVSASVYYSERHLGRIFENYIGMNMKTFSRLVRINKAIRLLQHPQCRLTSACVATGFYDVPHFIHAFQSVCGMTPQEYRSKMSDFYSEIAKF